MAVVDAENTNVSSVSVPAEVVSAADCAMRVHVRAPAAQARYQAVPVVPVTATSTSTLPVISAEPRLVPEWASNMVTPAEVTATRTPAVFVPSVTSALRFAVPAVSFNAAAAMPAR